MDDEPTATDADRGHGSAAQDSVFSNLPASRPGPRSPRRDRAQAAKAQTEQKAAAQPKRKAAAQPKQKQPAQPKATAKPKPKQPRPEPPSSAPEPETPQQHSGAGLEDLAWAGVAAAAEAATRGVRLATKAFDALRQNADRR
jgi:hypothetical protein